MRAIVSKLKPFCFLAVLLFMGWGLWALRDSLREALATARWLPLLGAALIAAIYLIFNASVWGLVLRLAKPEISRVQAAQVWIGCEAMRWLPGGIWGYASRVVEAGKLGVRKKVAGFSLAVELIITVAAWGTLALVACLFSPRLRASAEVYLERLRLPSTDLLSFVAGGVVIVVLALSFDLFGIRTLLQAKLGGLFSCVKKRRIVLRAFAEYLALSVFYGVGFLLCLVAVGVDPTPSFLDAAGSYALSWIIGFIAIGAPGGIGVREGILYLVFEPMGIGSKVATAAILWRAIQIVVELMLLAGIKLRGQTFQPSKEALLGEDDAVQAS